MNQKEVLLLADQPDQLENGAVTSLTEKYLLFTSGDLLFGVPAESVAEIITGHTITKLPLVPSYIRGIINLRGQIIPIVDIRHLLNHGDCESDCMMILRSDDTQVGILVDQVQKMVDIDVSTLLPVPPQSSNELVCGMCSLEDGQTMLAFDCAHLMEHS
ncbi:chemotaxis protein CheW [Lawsonibacter sp. LCP25S3_G6]|uniref:chemotaxis protein CheW n=1 Tax=unclassified Lawsonibacter TaxID=2617946 RepID=UPI003F9C71D2